MSAARKTLKILALIYFVLGIASLVIAGVGIARGSLDSTYGPNAMLAAAVIIAKGLIDLAAGVAGAADGTDAPVYAGNVLRQLPSVDRQKVPPMVTGRDRADRTSGLPFPLDLLGQLPAVLVPQHIHQGQGVNGACSSAG